MSRHTRGVRRAVAAPGAQAKHLCTVNRRPISTYDVMVKTSRRLRLGMQAVSVRGIGHA